LAIAEPRPVGRSEQSELPRRVKMGSKRLLSALSWTYTAGYLAYLIVAGIKTWPTTTWSAWWSDLALQAAWDAAFWPYYFPRLLGLW
jgi:hypothetical protein